MKVSDIVTKVIKNEDEVEGYISFAIKALVENDSHSESIMVALQGLDSDGFEIYNTLLTGKIPIGESNMLTTKDSINKELFEQIVKWQDKGL